MMANGEWRMANNELNAEVDPFGRMAIGGINCESGCVRADGGLQSRMADAETRLNVIHFSLF